MRRTDNIRKSFDFLINHATNNTTFLLQDFIDASGWAKNTAETYISKKLTEFVTPTNNVYSVRRQLLWVDFRDYAKLFSQKQTLFATYTEEQYPNVTTYEFFLPLTNETLLKQALDDLFYKDTIEQLLRATGVDRAEEFFPKIVNESEQSYIDRICDFAGHKFVGYSINHVSGHFRASELMTKDDASILEKQRSRYIVDETTAIVRFILPSTSTRFTTDTQLSLDEQSTTNLEVEEKQTDWLFQNLFVNVIKEVTTNQDEIWMLRNSTSQLHKYVSDAETD